MKIRLALLEQDLLMKAHGSCRLSFQLYFGYDYHLSFWLITYYRIAPRQFQYNLDVLSCSTYIWQHTFISFRLNMFFLTVLVNNDPEDVMMCTSHRYLLQPSFLSLI